MINNKRFFSSCLSLSNCNLIYLILLTICQNFCTENFLLEEEKTRITEFIPHGMLNDNDGSDRLAGPGALTSQLLQTETTISLLARPLSESSNCARLVPAPVLGQGISPTHTINVAQLP